MKSSSLRTLVAAALLTASVAAPAFAKSSDHREFDGTIVHISKENIKVQGVEGGKNQTLSFTGNFTNQKNLHPGEYVRVIFDQKLLGLRHADEVAPYGGSHMMHH